MKQNAVSLRQASLSLATGLVLTMSAVPALQAQEKTGVPESATAPGAGAAAAPAAGDSGKAEAGKALTLEAGEFTLKVDSAGWTAKEPPRPMSKGGFSLLKDGKPLADADVYHFGEGQGGNVESNLLRWQSQFEPVDGKPPEVKRSALKYGEAKATLVEIAGTFLSGSMFGPKKPQADHVMLGAILESKQGHVFIKLVVPNADLEKSREAFKKLVNSAYAVAPTEAKEEAPATPATAPAEK